MINNKNFIIPWIVACALFMETLDTTIISTAVPTMAHYFNISPVSLKLAMTSYLISLAIFVPISGYLADRYSAKKIFIYAFILFTSSSVFCAIASSLWQLVIFRVIQGIGGAIMMPVGRLILLRLYPKEELVKVTNYVTIPALFGPMLGPVAGGFITTYVSWHWIFLVSLPVGIFAIYLAYKYIPQIPSSLAVNKFDYKGFIFFGIGLSSLSFLLSTIYENSIDKKMQLTLLILSVIALLLYTLNYKIFTSILLNFDVFKTRIFRITVLGSLFSRIGIGGI